MPDRPGDRWLEIFSISASAALIGLLGLACAAVVGILPLDAEIRPNDLIEWGSYGLLVPGAVVLCIWCVLRAARLYLKAFRRVQGELADPTAGNRPAGLRRH